MIASLGTWWGVCTETLARFREDPPDVLLTVDFPGLNVRLARWAKKRGVRTVHLVAPAVWAYSRTGSSAGARALDRLLTHLPVRAAVLYENAGVPSLYVGHPLFEAPLAPPRTPEACPGGGPCRIELLPGSRRQEIRAHAKPLLDAAAALEAAFPEARFVVRLAKAEHVERFEAAAQGAARRPARLDVAVGDEASGPVPLLGALACSGTVTAELGAALVPLAILYRVTWLARLGAWAGITAPFIGLANLVAGHAVVPERLQVTSSGRRIAEDFLRVAGDGAAWTRTREALAIDVRARLEVAGVADRAARAVLAGR